MSLQFRKVTEQQRLTFTPVVGEPVYTLDTNNLYIGDGVTVGGVNAVSNILVQDFLDADLEESELRDGDFIYYDSSDDKWKIGKHLLELADLDDVTGAEEIEEDLMLVYDEASGKWLIREPLPKTLGDVEEFDTTQPISNRGALQYDEETGKFVSTDLPPVPGIGDLLGISLSGEPQRGQLLFLDKDTETFNNDYISYSTGSNYHANLYDQNELDIIRFNADSGYFEKSTPFLKDVNLLTLDGVEEAPPEDIEIKVSVNEGFFIFDEVRVAPALELLRKRVYVFDLSDPTLLGKTFAFSTVLDGTHSIDPPGEILEHPGITVTGTPGVDGELRLNLNPIEEATESIPLNFYYFCVEEPEFGNTVTLDDPPSPYPFVLYWDEAKAGFDVKRFNYSIAEFGDVLITPDDDGNIANFQMLSWDTGLGKWTTPLDRVVGVGIGGLLPRTYTEYSNAMWSGGVQGLGTFDLTLEEGSELKSITIKLSELEIEGQEEEFDAYFFESEEEREEFFEAIEEAEAALRSLTGDPNAVLSREAIDDIATEKSAKKARLLSNKKSYTRVGKSVVPTAGVEVEIDPETGESSGDGFGGLGALGSAASGFMGLLGGLGLGGGAGGGDGGGEGVEEPGLDELTSAVPNPEEEAEAFKDAYKNVGNNLKKVFGALMARRRAIKELLPNSLAGGDAGGGIDLEYEVSNPTGAQSQDKPPMMLGWRASTDVYGYYYFTYNTRSSALTYNSRNHELSAQASMRRCGCTIDGAGTFKVVFYYDADDSRYIAGQWLRIVEWQSPRSLYTGDLEELPSSTIRASLTDWEPGVKYRRGSRVIYNDQVWECLIEISEASPPAAGQTLAPTYVEGKKVEMFVEIPAFSVKSQLFEGVYQLRCTAGKDSFGGKTHPVFGFGEPGDSADYVYVGVNLWSLSAYSHLIPNSAGSDVVRINHKSSHRQQLSAANLDIGVFLYDINVHSAIQHLMVGEFQTFNIEKRLGECNLSPTTTIGSAERLHSALCGNGSGATLEGVEYGDYGSAPEGIPTYRGIFRPYGNMGCFIDGLNVNAKTGAASFNLDSSLHLDNSPQPAGYTFLENLPRPSLDSNGTGASFISDFFTWRRQDYSDFVFYLPKAFGGGRDNFLGDYLRYRQVPNTETLVTPSCGSPYSSPLLQSVGANGPFSLNLQPLGPTNHTFATRLCVKRRGAPLVPKTQQVGVKELGTVVDATGAVLATNVEQSAALPGQTWTKDKEVPIYEVVPGNTRSSGEAGTSTVSLARKEQSKSAICIGVCDESSSLIQPYDKWENFRSLFPRREHWLLVPSESQAYLTTPEYDSVLDYGNSNLATLLQPVPAGATYKSYSTGFIPAQGTGGGSIVVAWDVSSPLTTNNSVIPDNYNVEIFRTPGGPFGGNTNYDLMEFRYEWRWNVSTSESSPDFRRGSLTGGYFTTAYVTSQLDNAWNSVAYSPTLNRYVAVSGETGTWDVMYSDTGAKTWTILESPIGSDSISRAAWRQVIWAPGLDLFVAIGEERNGSKDRIMTSPDGVNWTIRSVPLPTGQTAPPNVYGVAYSPELNLLVATCPNATLQSILTSSDGITWTLRTIPSAPANAGIYGIWKSICWSSSQGCFLAAGNPFVYPHPFLKSTDGINWTEVEVSNISTNFPFKKIIYSEQQQKFIAIIPGSWLGISAWTSPDGETWTGTSIANQSFLWNDVAYSPVLDIYVVVHGTTGYGSIAYSYDGVTWNLAEIPTFYNAWSAIIWSDEDQQFVAVASYGYGDRVMTSSDGINWTLRQSMALNETSFFFKHPTLQWRHIPSNNDFNTSTLIGVELFGGIGAFSPVSLNQRLSKPFTYAANLNGYASVAGTQYAEKIVWVVDVINGISDGNAAPSQEGETIIVNYKIRIPPGIENITNDFRIFGGADSSMKVTIQNPLTEDELVKEWEYSNWDLDDAYRYLSTEEIANVLSPTTISEENQWLNVTVEVQNSANPDLPAPTYNANPAAYALCIEVRVNNVWATVFNAREWTCHKNFLYGTSNVYLMRVPLNRMVEASRGVPSYGPHPVTRDNGNTSLITDWFKLCKLERLPAGTLVGLFIDRSGSMTQGTIAASYSYFYQKCENAGLRVVEVQNANEDWITPFIDEI